MVATLIISISEFNTLTDTFFYFLSKYKNIGNYEIIVIEDSEKSLIPKDYFLKFGLNTTKLIRTNSKKGYGYANNYGARYASSEILFFLNDDIIAKPGCFEKLISDITTGKADAVQPKLIYPQTNRIQSTGHVFTTYTNAHALAGSSSTSDIANKPAIRTALTTALCATSKKLFLQMNMFDETYFNAWEGMEFTLKLTLNGFKCVYEPEAEAYHIQGAARGLYKIDETAQSAIFWSRWSNKIIEDLHKMFLLQLSPERLHKAYVVLNFSRHPKIIELLKKSNLNITDDVTYMLYSGLPSIDFFKILPTSILEFNTSIIYFCNNFNQISNNKLWFELRQNKNDLILDLHGNVIHLF